MFPSRSLWISKNTPVMILIKNLLDIFPEDISLFIKLRAMTQNVKFVSNCKNSFLKTKNTISERVEQQCHP